MPGTFLGYPFDEELFLMQWQAAQDPVKLAMLNSGAIQSNATIKNLISNGSNVYTIPFYDVLGGEPDNYDGQTDITTTEPTGASQSGVVYGRAHGWKDRDFIHDFNSGADPMKQITSQVSRFWDKKRQGTVLKILDGVFGTTDDTGGYLNKWKQHIVDISAEGEGVMSETTMGDAAQAAVGDNSDIFSLCWMHSKVAQNLANLQLLTFRKYTDPNGIERQLKIADYNGKTVIVDDDCPYDSASGLYTTYALGLGAIQYADAPVKTPVEMVREAKLQGGFDEIITRLRETYHPNGFSFKLPVGCISPTNAQLGAAANWMISVDPKLIPLVKIVSKG